MSVFRIIIVLILSFLITLSTSAQIDSLILVNGDVIVGEIKDMDRGVVTVETDYSDDDFKIEWNGINEIFTTTYFTITLTDGTRLSGRLASTAPGQVSIITDDSTAQNYKLNDLVYLKSLEKGFWKRFSVNIDIGFSMAKSNNLLQLSMQSKVGYLVEKWSLDASYNTLFSRQDDADDISRREGTLSYYYFLPKDWYIPVSLSFLSNSEQKIDLRTLVRAGLGKFVIHTNHSYWGFAGGITYNNENYSEAEDRESWEGYVGSELNLYDIGDLNLMTKLVAYPSFTESGRWRVDYILDTKYDLPLDFYIKIGLTVNYDNQPVEGAPRTDYVLQTGLGWEW